MIRAFTFCFILLLAINAYAQKEVHSTIILKTGREVKGVILDSENEEEVRVRQASGQVVVIAVNDIDEVHTSEHDMAHRIGYSFTVDATIAYDVSSGLKYRFIEPRLINGVRIENLTMGLGLGLMHGNGIGVKVNTDPYVERTVPRKNIVYMPVFLNSRRIIGDKKARGLADISVGYPISLNTTTESAGRYVPSSGGTQGYTDYFMQSQTGILYLSGISGVAINFGKINLGIGFKYALLIFNERFEVNRVPFNSPNVPGEIINEGRGPRLCHTVGLAVGILY